MFPVPVTPQTLLYLILLKFYLDKVSSARGRPVPNIDGCVGNLPKVCVQNYPEDMFRFLPEDPARATWAKWWGSGDVRPQVSQTHRDSRHASPELVWSHLGAQKKSGGVLCTNKTAGQRLMKIVL